MASQETTISQDFKNTISNTERELINNLISHYEKIITTYEGKLQCNLTKINEIKVRLILRHFHHHNVFQATKRNVENITIKKQYITDNKLDNRFFEKYKRRRPRENAVLLRLWHQQV